MRLILPGLLLLLLSGCGLKDDLYLPDSQEGQPPVNATTDADADAEAETDTPSRGYR